jgi:hypothetical protein
MSFVPPITGVNVPASKMLSVSDGPDRELSRLVPSGALPDVLLNFTFGLPLFSCAGLALKYQRAMAPPLRGRG